MKPVLRYIGALLSPQGVYFVEYRRAAGGLEIMHRAGDSALLPRPMDAARTLLSQLQSQPGENEYVVAAVVRGFGSVYHIMTVPRAGRDMLMPIARRELGRLYPELDEPTVEFVRGAAVEDSASVQQEILIGAAPQVVVNAIVNGVVAENVRLTHLTVLPRAMQRLYDEVDGSSETTAVALFLPGGPLIAFYHDGVLRQASEPPVLTGLSAVEHVPTVLEQVTRGDLYMRQHYHGATIERLLVSAHPYEQELVLDALKRELAITVLPFAQEVGPPGALAALGAVLDAEAPQSLSLLPPDPAIVQAQRQKIRRLVMASAAVLCVATAWWAWTGFRGIARGEDRIEAAQALLTRDIDRIAAMRATVARRQQHAGRLAYVHGIEQERDRMAGALEAAARAAPRTVQLTAMTVAYAPAGLHAVIDGLALGRTSADAVRSLNAFYERLPVEAKTANVTVDSFDYTETAQVADAPASDATIKFRISFTSDAGATP